MYLVAPISSRNQFGHLLNSKGLIGDAVEIGTHRGVFASQLLRHWNGLTLHCVDPWSIPQGYEEQAKLLPEKGPTRDDDKTVALEALKPYSNRCRIHQVTSVEAAGYFLEGSLDFIYIDGNHEQKYVEQDLRMWWPKLRKGGVLSGHDIICPGEVDLWGKHIQPAVNWFIAGLRTSREIDPPVYLVVEEDGLPWSYYIVKD